MPYCQNCGEFVTAQYARVFAPPGIEGVRACPGCEDKVRSGATVRDAHTVRETNNLR